MKDAVWRVKEEEEKKKGRDGNVEKEGKVSGSDRSERSRQRRMEDVLHLRETGFYSALPTEVNTLTWFLLTHIFPFFPTTACVSLSFGTW